MRSSEAISAVHRIVRGALEREHGSPTIVNIFNQQISETLVRLRQQFQDAKSCNNSPVMIWPKMVTGFRQDDDEEITPVFGPIRNAEGHILCLKVISRTQNGQPRPQRVHLDWADPEI